MQELKARDKRIDTLEKRIIELKNYIEENDENIRAPLRLLYKPMDQEEPVLLREYIDSLHQRLNMLESESPSDK
jgi:polyhydroxyalkanoate synthesis regulator phasin